MKKSRFFIDHQWSSFSLLSFFLEELEVWVKEATINNKSRSVPPRYVIGLEYEAVEMLSPKAFSPIFPLTFPWLLTSPGGHEESPRLLQLLVPNTRNWILGFPPSLEVFVLMGRAGRRDLLRASLQVFWCQDSFRVGRKLVTPPIVIKNN